MCICYFPRRGDYWPSLCREELHSLQSKPCGSRVNRVTRKVNLADRSAGYQCHSVFTQAERFASLLGRADYGNAAAEVKIVVVECSIKHACHSTTDSQQQHGQRATAQTIVIVALCIRCSGSCTLTSSNLLDGPTSFELRDARKGRYMGAST